MQITLFSFFSAILWHSVLIIVIYFFRRFRFKQYYDMFLMVMLYLFSIIRMFIPFEFPNAIVLESAQVYTKIYSFLVSTYHIGNTSFSAISFLFILWIVVLLILLIQYTFEYYAAMRAIIRHAMVGSEKAQSVLSAIQQATKKHINVCVLSLPNIDTPFGVGIFHRYILLPIKDYPDSDLYYILLHEYTHFRNKDIVLKLLINIFCIIFWWNPVVYLLRKDLEQTLEMKCDVAIAKSLDSKGKAAYLRTIYNTLEGYPVSQTIMYTSTAFFKCRRALEVKERFYAVRNCNKNNKNRTLNFLLLGSLVLIIFSSYTVIPQPVFEAPVSTEPNVIEFDATDSYIRQISNGEYWLYTINQQPQKITEKEAEFYKQINFTIVKE